MRRIAAALALACCMAGAAAGEPPLTVCIADDSAPYSRLESGEPRGLDVALMRAVADRLGRPLQLLWFEGRYDREGNLSLDARALLAAGACELVAGIPLYEPHLAPMIAERARTPDHPGAKPLRQRPWQALVPVTGGAAYRATAMVLVGRGAQAVQDLQALRGHTVAVRAGSMASMALGAWNGGALASAIRGLNVREDVLAAVESGQADYALVDVALWDRHRSLHPGTVLAPTGYEHPVKINIGLLARSSDAALLQQAEAALAALAGTPAARGIAAAQQATWIAPVQPPVRPALSLRDFAGPGG